MPYSELYCHLVWTAKDRTTLLTGGRAELVEHAIRAACREHGAIAHGVGIMPDHVHLAVSMPPRLAVSELMRLVKGSVSHLLNTAPNRGGAESFAWQAEYGALSFGKRSLAAVVAYVVNQPAHHHAANDLWPTFERSARDIPKPGDGLDSGT
jgi:putative transposase